LISGFRGRVGMGQLRLTREPMTIGEASGERLDH